MASLSGGLGVPHTPYFPKIAADQGPDGEINSYFKAVRQELESDKPDVIVLIDTDHFSAFYFDNFPTFGVGVDQAFYGPVDDVALCPPREIPSHEGLARHLHTTLIRNDFDSSFVTHYKVGHSIGVPLYFLTPQFDVPVVPVFVNGHLPPMPSAQRLLAFGKALRRGIDSFDQNVRVEVIGTGSFSLDVAGPFMSPGENFGVPDLPWALRVQALMEQGDIEQLISEATEQRMLAAGNVGGELLNWIAMIGAVGTRKAKWMMSQPERGHAYGAWAAGTQS